MIPRICLLMTMVFALVCGESLAGPFGLFGNRGGGNRSSGGCSSGLSSNCQNGQCDLPAAEAKPELAQATASRSDIAARASKKTREQVAQANKADHSIRFVVSPERLAMKSIDVVARKDMLVRAYYSDLLAGKRKAPNELNRSPIQMAKK